MRARTHSLILAVAVVTLLGPAVLAQRGAAPPTPPRSSPLPPAPPNPRLDALKKEVVADVESRRVFTQQLVDSLFSFSELGFQEVETQHRVTDALVKEGFDVQRGYANVPTSWVAKWGSGHPIIAIGTDIDGLPTTNQTPGVVTRKELVPGAPDGLGEAVASGGSRAVAELPLPPAIHAKATHAADVAFVSGMNEILVIGAIICFVGAILGFLLVRSEDFVQPTSG